MLGANLNGWRAVTCHSGGEWGVIPNNRRVHSTPPIHSTRPFIQPFRTLSSTSFTRHCPPFTTSISAGSITSHSTFFGSSLCYNILCPASPPLTFSSLLIYWLASSHRWKVLDYFLFLSLPPASFTIRSLVLSVFRFIRVRLESELPSSFSSTSPSFTRSPSLRFSDQRDLRYVHTLASCILLPSFSLTCVFTSVSASYIQQTISIIMPVIKKSLAGPGWAILNVLRAMNIVSLLMVIAACWVMLVKTFVVSKVSNNLLDLDDRPQILTCAFAW